MDEQSLLVFFPSYDNTHVYRGQGVVAAAVRIDSVGAALLSDGAASLECAVYSKYTGWMDPMSLGSGEPSSAAEGDAVLELAGVRVNVPLCFWVIPLSSG